MKDNTLQFAHLRFKNINLCYRFDFNFIHFTAYVLCVQYIYLKMFTIFIISEYCNKETHKTFVSLHTLNSRKVKQFLWFSL